MGTLHIFTARNQPLTRHKPYGSRRYTHVSPYDTRFECDCCWKRRAARNLVIQCYYDMVRILCAEGCKPITYREKRAYWRKQKRLQSNG